LTAKLTAIQGDTPLSWTIHPDGENGHIKERRAGRVIKEVAEQRENGVETGVL
jgi:hypothetical protein